MLHWEQIAEEDAAKGDTSLLPDNSTSRVGRWVAHPSATVPAMTKTSGPPEHCDLCDSDVTIGKNERGTWCVYIDGRLISTHRSRDGAAISANQLIEAERSLS